MHTTVFFFQVITGGQYDVDVKIEGPNKQIIYQQQKMQYDSHQFTAQITGIFINEPFYLMLLLLNVFYYTLHIILFFYSFENN